VTGGRVEPVVREQPVAVGGDQLDGGGDVAGGGRGDEVVEVDPGRQTGAGALGVGVGVPGQHLLRMKSSMKSSDRPEAV
jgi:hypothetical protein